MEDVRQAISALVTAAVPVLTGTLDAVGKNADGLSNSGKKLVEALKDNAKPLADATANILVAGVSLASGAAAGAAPIPPPRK